MDVEAQMESKGLPQHFSTSDPSHGSHVTENLAASISNSEAKVDISPSKQPVTESPLPPEPAPAVTEAVAEKLPESVPQAASQPSTEAAQPSTNGVELPVSEPAQDPAISASISAVPDSQPQPTETDTAATASLSETKTTESFVPSSIPTEIQSSATTVEATQPTMDVSEPSPVPAQAPISDLRTSPHADALTPDAVADVEARKHELDNSADALTATSKPDVMDTSFPTVPATAALTGEADQPSVTNIGLPSPPAQSPPSAPQPAPATLSEEKPAESAPAPVSAPLPAEQPKEPAPTPAAPAPASIEPKDQVMEDVSSQPVKQVHGREDDHVGVDAEPAAKRVRTEEPQSSQQADFKVPDVPTPSAQTTAPALANGNNATAAATNGITDGDDSVTPARLAHMRKVISNLKKSNASAAFRLPVDPVALNIPNYPLVVTQPMDLGTIDQRLKRNEYTSVSAFISDFQLIVSNCVKFNGPDHGVTQSARKMESSFNNQMRNLPKATIEEPAKDNKKAAKRHEPTRSAPPRRPSVSTSTGAASSHTTPKAPAPSAPSFAPGPDGIPLIRRDSTMADGRPKRAIVPTKRNQEFGGGRPKKKKYELQLKFCDQVLKELMGPKNWYLNQYFTHPVDPVALNIPTYFQIIKKPMDLGTIRNKLNNNVYEKAKDFEEDVRLIFKNCYKFNPEGDLVNTAGHQLEELFNKLWAGKDEWIASREPQSEPQSDVEAEDDEDESEEDAEDSEEERNDKIKQLQKQIEEMSKQMGELTQKKHKKSKSPPTKKSKSKSSKKEKPAASFPNLGKDKKEKKKSAPRSKPDRYVTFAEKQYISNGIAMLPEKQMQEALKIIQNSVPSLANSDQNEIELDIEEVPNQALLKLLNFVKRYAGPPPDEPKVEQADVYAPVQKTKKSKPMSKHEQEAQIEELKGKLGAYHGAISPTAVPSIEDGDSSDDGDSEESEEE
ncbi:hypothetical protein A1O1_07810 [Capronia coronata CBS 617.96]|uniref:Bromodomain-containing protein n=1 Tax=Capronia coronata CBS 617.96 TaxID=1182541 RepID=W9XWK3_9EURO|nr:uncharacterized protein A1O1_07810 [Capronia coronata CBS 617.96]EXJ81745.1 hypothetical protein A1O1_07810 [Capronia coronata CBS 617.96]